MDTSLLSSPEYFRCDHYAARMPMKTCVARRNAKRNGGSYGYNGYVAASYPACQECEQGRDIERRYAEMAHEEQPCTNCHRKVRTLFDGLCGFCDASVLGLDKESKEYAAALAKARGELSRTMPGKKNQTGERSVKGVGKRPNGGRGECRNCGRKDMSIKQDDLCALCYGRIKRLSDPEAIKTALQVARNDVARGGKAIRVKPQATVEEQRQQVAESLNLCTVYIHPETEDDKALLAEFERIARRERRDIAGQVWRLIECAVEAERAT